MNENDEYKVEIYPNGKVLVTYPTRDIEREDLTDIVLGKSVEETIQ